MAICPRRSSGGILSSDAGNDPRLRSRVSEVYRPANVRLDSSLAAALPDDHLGIRQATFLLNVQVFHFQGMGLDEISAWLNFVTHENREDLIDPWHILEFDPQQRARFRVH